MCHVIGNFNFRYSHRISMHLHSITDKSFGIETTNQKKKHTHTQFDNNKQHFNTTISIDKQLKKCVAHQSQYHRPKMFVFLFPKKKNIELSVILFRYQL